MEYRSKFKIERIFFLFIVSLFSNTFISNVHALEVESPLRLKALSEIEVKREYLTHIIGQQERLVNALVGTPFMKTYLSTKARVDKENLTQMFLTTAAINEYFMQIRFLDVKGYEEIRIEQSADESGPIIVDKSELQDKSNREYYTGAKNAVKGELWYSAFDLNREQGAIETSLTPTYRIASPVYMDDEFYGVIVINLMMSRVIAHVTESKDFDVLLVDAENNILIHPDSKRSWSQYLPNRKKYSKTVERDVESYSQTLEDIFKNNEGIRIILIN